jgi:alginate O-acetyltransferase complex protein AlgI
LNFVSLQFLLFVIITLFIYWNLKDKFRSIVLLIASYIFYCFWDWRFASILVFVTISNYILTRLMHEVITTRTKKRLLAVCLTQNLVVLFIFKYFNFFTESAQRVFDFMGFSLDFPTINVLLPLGLSFLVFQTSSYIVDVFRGTIVPEKSFINFATFVVYFPHLAAGPIMPSKVLLPQISTKKVAPDFDGVQSALFLIAIGLFKKIVIADTLAPLVNRIYGEPTMFDWKSLSLAAIAFGLQIYGDFAGYSSIARGVSRLFGIEMMVNFRQPYLSTSITDFWRRWHISLSTWFRDYLYVPLGGNRGKAHRTSLNLMFVMVVAGLWHGADLGFVFWGFLHGLFLVIDKQFKRKQNLGEPKFFAVSLLGWLVTQISVFFAWIFFRNPDFGDAAYIIKSIIQGRQGTFEISDALLVLAALVVTILLDLLEIHLIPKERRINSFIKGLLLGVLLVVVFTLKSSSIIPFIYFEF